jgi:hypothetical protein
MPIPPQPTPCIGSICGEYAQLAEAAATNYNPII